MTKAKGEGEKPKMGRPSDYSADLATTICVRIADGESLRSICRGEDMPDKATVLRWLASDEHKNFRDQYAHARDAQADAIVEECLEIADDGTNDWMERNNGEDKSPGYALNGEHVQRSRLRVDTRKWWAARLAPKKYGDKVTTEISGPDGGPVPIDAALEVVFQRATPPVLPDAEIHHEEAGPVKDDSQAT